MKFAGRMNSFIFKGDKDLFETMEAYKHMKNITHLEFNYPEHLKGKNIDEIKKRMGCLKVNGVATRFKSHYVNGEFTNPDKKVREDAVAMCKEAIDVCRELGGDVVTVWQAYDGYDYPFQMEYETAWKLMIKAFREIADYAGDIKISIEYKPFEPRNYAMLDSVGTTLLAVKEIGRDNVGITLDFCHMLMKHDNPAYAIMLVAKEGKLFGLHLNDGYCAMDSGLIFGSVNFSQCFEFVYYLKKYKYDRVIFFDSFPVREDTEKEMNANMEAFIKMSSLIDDIGMNRVEEVINKHDGVASQQFIMSMLR